MKHLVTLTAVLALCVPAAALAADAQPSATSLAAKSCKTQRVQMGTAAFKALYPSTNKCLGKATVSAQTQLQNAAKTCKAERADAGFATEAGHNGMTFDAFYGTAKGKSTKGAAANAFGKCVSSTTTASNQAQTDATIAAAKSCKADRKSDAATFAKNYKSFGACVSKQAKGKS